MAIVLRPYVPADAAQLTRHLNDPRIAAWLADVPVPYASAHASQFIEAHSQTGAAYLAFAIVGERTPDVLIGGIGSRPPPDEARAALARHGHANIAISIGYWIAEKYWGQGLATQALEMALPRFAARHGGAQACAMTLVDHPASARVLQKCGFTHITQAEMPHQGDMELGDIYARDLDMASTDAGD